MTPDTFFGIVADWALACGVAPPEMGASGCIAYDDVRDFRLGFERAEDGMMVYWLTSGMNGAQVQSDLLAANLRTSEGLTVRSALKNGNYVRFVRIGEESPDWRCIENAVQRLLPPAFLSAGEA